MNAEEGTTLVKMAITVLLVGFVIGAIMSLFYWLYGLFNTYHSGVTDDVNSTIYERVYELCDLTKKGEYPLVTNVANMLDSFYATDLIYVTVTIDGPSPQHYVYTFPGVDTSSLTGTINVSDVPTSMAMKELLRHSECRCMVKLTDVNNGSIIFHGIEVEVLDET